MAQDDLKSEFWKRILRAAEVEPRPDLSIRGASGFIPPLVAVGLVGLVGFWRITDNLQGTGVLAASTAYSVGATYEFSVIPLLSC
jgi:hypothetical protein